MFDIGFSEVLLIFGLTLVVLGPDKLPQVARTIGRWAGRARAMARQFRDQLEAESEGLKNDFKVPMPPDNTMAAHATHAPSPPTAPPPSAPPPFASASPGSEPEPPPAPQPAPQAPSQERPGPTIHADGDHDGRE